MELTMKNGVAGKEYMTFVSQNICGMIGISCYILADTFFISQAAGADGITVLNLCLPVYNLIFAIGSMLGVGAATRFAIFREQKDASADDFFANAIMWALICSVPFVIAGVFFPGNVLAWMGADAAIKKLGIPYAGTFLPFAPFFMLNHIINAFVRNDNHPTLAMAATLSGSLFNIIFDYIFMFPMDMGLQGAALATAISPIVSASICAMHFFRKKNHIRFVWQVPKIRRLGQSCQLGTAAFIGEFSSGVTTTVFNFLILGIAGNIGVAAYGIIANFALVAVAVFNGVALGSQPLFSKYFGRGDRRTLRQLFHYAAVTGLFFAVVIYIIVFARTDLLAALFNSGHSPELASLAVTGMRLYFTGFLFAGQNMIISGFLSAVGEGVKAALVSFSRGVVAIVLCALVLSHFFAMNGIWLAFPMAEGLTFLLAVICFRRTESFGK